MHVRSVLTSLILISSTVSVSVSQLNVRSPNAIKEVHTLPPQWSKRELPPATHLIDLLIGLKQSQMDELERRLYEVSNPDSSKYGEHLTEAEVHELMKPANDTYTLVHDWLFDHGITEVGLEYSAAKDWIKLTLPVERVERMLDAQYFVFEHDHGQKIVRTLQWSLPIHLHQHVDVIQPTTSFFGYPVMSSVAKLDIPVDDLASPQPGINKRFAKRMGPSQACNASAITPFCLQKLYGTFDYTPSNSASNPIGISNFLGESCNVSDVQMYMQRYRPDLYPKLAQGNLPINFQSVANGQNQQIPSSPEELSIKKDHLADLNAEVIFGLSALTPVTAYSTGGTAPTFNPDLATPFNMNEPYLEWAQYVLSQPSPPLVISTTYSEDEQTVPVEYARRVCGDFMALGARGVTLLFSSGDNGVGKDPYCTTNNGTNAATFLPQFPASCPYVTTVGATQNINPEIVAYNQDTKFSSGGGFSNYFPRPHYQNQSVNTYLVLLGDTFEDLFNRAGRAYPDVSAQGSSFATIWNNQVIIQEGTAAATATVASIFSLINDARLAYGQSSLGFVNPLIYSKAGPYFADVTQGSSIGCNTTGFEATVGWDPVSGFGTPYFPRLCHLLTGAPTCGYGSLVPQD